MGFVGVEVDVAVGRRETGGSVAWGVPIALPVGVDVRRDKSLLSMMFLGLMGDRGSTRDSFWVATDEFNDPVCWWWFCDRKKVENPDAGVLGVLVSLFGVEYRSSIVCCEGVAVLVPPGCGRFFSCSVQ